MVLKSLLCHEIMFFYTTCCMSVMQTCSWLMWPGFYPEFKSDETTFLFNNSIATILYPIISQQIFAHTTTAQLSWHVQKFVVISMVEFGWDQLKFLSNLSYRWQIVSGMGPHVCLMLTAHAKWAILSWLILHVSCTGDDRCLLPNFYLRKLLRFPTRSTYFYFEYVLCSSIETFADVNKLLFEIRYDSKVR